MSKEDQKYNLEDIEKAITQPWTPFDVAKFNNQVVRAAVFEGEYPWHSHDNEDEFFLVYKGSIVIETETGSIPLNTGEVAVIKKGRKHRPIAAQKAFVLMVEPESLVSGGD